jgi:hypothetical protein
MKNEGLIHHRQSEVQEDGPAKMLAGVGVFVFAMTIVVWAGAAFAIIWLFNRWGFIDFYPEWWEVNIVSAVVNFIRLWDRTLFAHRP